MICQRCHRPMQTPAAVVQTRAGRSGYGPKCAAIMGILPAHKSARVRRQAVASDPAQMELIELEVA